MKIFHGFHILDVSPWPFFFSFSLMNFFFFFVIVFKENFFFSFDFFFSFFLLVVGLFFWWRDVLRESFGLGFHSGLVKQGLKLGFVLFIVSEVMFFFSFFWAFFYYLCSSDIQLGGVFPPQGILLVSPYSVPFLNTLVLLSSGVVLTFGHYSLMMGNLYVTKFNFFFTVLLGFFFFLVQLEEYSVLLFSINDSVFGSLFFLLTGFHGLHIILGIFMLIVSYFRFNKFHFSKEKFLFFEFSIWYWHFVDVIWLFLYIFVYWLYY